MHCWLMIHWDAVHDVMFVGHLQVLIAAFVHFLSEVSSQTFFQGIGK